MLKQLGLRVLLTTTVWTAIRRGKYSYCAPGTVLSIFFVDLWHPIHQAALLLSHSDSHRLIFYPHLKGGNMGFKEAK